MNSLFLHLAGLALVLGAHHGMQPRILSDDGSHCTSMAVRDGHIVLEEVCTKRTGGPKKNSRAAQVTWNGQVATITRSDEKASQEWIQTHSLLRHLSAKHGNLYWKGKKVDLGKTYVSRIDEAIPWQNGVLIFGSTVPRKGFFHSWPFKGPLIKAREIDPYCAIYFDTGTLKGEDHWFGKVPFGYLVFPLPD